MRFNIALSLSLLSTTLLTQVHACPPDDEQLARITAPLKAKFDEDICGQGIKPGGSKDLKWITNIILPYYVSKKWLSKDFPKGWEKEADKIISKCHKNDYNYCSESHHQEVGECVKGTVGSLMLKYGATAMAYCPILDKVLGDEAEVLAWFTVYCKTKGVIC